MNTDANTVNIDGKEVEVSALPQASVIALLQRGINHVLGNEVASKISTAKKATKGGEGADKDELKYTEADLEKMHEETYGLKVKAILEGTLGVRGPGVTKLSPLDKMIREVAWDVIVNSPGVKSGKVKLPTGKGSGEARAAMMDKVIEAHKDLLTKKAQQRMDDNAALAGDVLGQA